MAHKHVKTNKLSASGKEEQYWSSINREKLDTLRYTLLHSGLNAGRLQNDDGMTGLMVAAKGGKDTALLLMLDIFRQQRCVKEVVDVADDDGRTPLMYAAAAGHPKCVDHLVYYGASLTAKSEEGMTARDYAVKFKRHEVVEYFDDDGKDDDDGAGGGAGDEAVDADGLTSTQRSKLKKKQMKEAERKGMIAAVSAAAAATTGDGAADGAADGLAALSLGGDGAGAAAAAVGPHGVPPLPSPAPKPRWPETAVVLAENRRELKADKTGAAATAANAEPGAPIEDACVGEDAVDPAVWHAVQLHRLEMRLPHLTVLSPRLGHLTALHTLILSGNGLTALPEALAACVELKHLDVAHNALTELPPLLGRLAKLEVLSVADNRLTTLAPLAGSTSLLTLLADRNQLTEVGPLSFAELARLDTLSLSGNKLTALPEEVRWGTGGGAARHGEGHKIHLWTAAQ